MQFLYRVEIKEKQSQIHKYEEEKIQLSIFALSFIAAIIDDHPQEYPFLIPLYWGT